MNQYVIFLRGVNVGGNATVKMDVLKKSLTQSGFKQIISYINSGNLWVSSELDKIAAKKTTAAVIQKQFGLTVEMILKTKEELNEIIQNDPFDINDTLDLSKKIVMMLSKEVDQVKIANFESLVKGNERFKFLGDLLYVYYSEGMGRSRFTNNFVENKLQVVSTARNWNTIVKMNDLYKPFNETSI